jgi:hypothetical protein
MCVYYQINWMTTNGVVVMLNCGPMARPQTIKMTARRFPVESLVDG